MGYTVVGALTNWLERIVLTSRICHDVPLLQTVKARSKSVNTLGALRTNSAGLSQQQQDMALKRLLGQSWQVQTKACCQD